MWLLLAGWAGILLSVPAAAQDAIAPEAARLYTVVENGGFEAGTEVPEWWGRHPAKPQNRNRHARDTQVVHNGSASARIDWLEPIAGENKAPIQWSRYNLPVEGGIELIFSGYVKTEGVAPAHVGLNTYDRDKQYVGFAKVQCPAKAEDWTYVRGSLKVPPEAASMGFVLYSREGGRTWYDDVALLGVPEVEAAWATPKVDGVLDDPCWTQERALTAFVQSTGASLAHQPVQAWVSYDDTALYVAFRCPYPLGSALKRDGTQRDGDIASDERVEVFLDPKRDCKDYYHFSVNCAGVVRDAHRRDAAWNSSAVAKTSSQCDAWMAELAIPYADLDLDLSVSDRWGINLVRNDRSTGETVTWSLGGLHNAARFGGLGLHPHLSPILRPALARETHRQRQQFQTLAQALKNAGSSAAYVEKAERLLTQAREKLDRAEGIASGAIAAPKATVGEMKAWAAEIDTLLEKAHAAIQGARFAVPAQGEKVFALVAAGSMQKIPRTKPVVRGPIVERVQLEAAKDETESFQLVVIPAGTDLASITVDAPPLQGPGGSLKPEWHRVDYVETGAAKSYKAEYVGWWPDVLLPPGPFGVKAGNRQPLWFKVSVPPDATPGIYWGHVNVEAKTGAQRERKSVPVEVRVRDFRLPRPGSLPTAFGLYAHALSNWYHGKKYYQDVMTPETYARWCEFMGQYRLTPKNIANEYHRRTGEGEAKRLDLSLLQTTLAANAERYYPPNSFCVYRLPCPRDVQDGTTKTDPAVWVRALEERAREYTRLDLPREAYIYGVDEPHPSGYPFIRNLYAMVKKATPGFPIMQTVNHEPPHELAGLVDIWCPLSSKLEDSFYRERREAGDTLWTYVCCSPKPPYANFFIDQPAIDHRMVFWQARQAGATGVLYWCVCWWRGLPGPPSGQPHFPEVPISLNQGADTFSHLDTNGDGILIWPGPDMTPYPSLRLEVVRDGIEDYEYLALLQRCVDHAAKLPVGKRPDSAIMRDARALCLVPDTVSRTSTDFTKDAEVLVNRRKAIGDMIERLVRVLGEEPPPEPRIHEEGRS